MSWWNERWRWDGLVSAWNSLTKIWANPAHTLRRAVASNGCSRRLAWPALASSSALMPRAWRAYLRDWYQLLEVCSIFGTLIADGERLYDPRLYHARLLLGLSGMMSEAELHQLKQRMQAGARHKAERGARRQGLPVGLARGPAGEVILNPDEEVQARIRLVLEQFREIGSASGVMRALRAAHLPVPARPRIGPAPYEVVWQPARTSAILDMLHNPAYAGAYVYGRKTLDPARRTPAHPSGGRILQPFDTWGICLHNRYPA